MRRATRWAILLTVALAVVIATLTLTPPIQTGMPAGSDKSYHLVAFVALTVPLATVRPRWGAALFVLFSAYGAAIEFIQPHVGRSQELADLIADMAGVALGLVLGLLIRRLVRRPSDVDERSLSNLGA